MTEFNCTVKPEYRPPDYNDHNLKVPYMSFATKVTAEQQPPVNNGHYFGVPRVVAARRFDCTSKSQCNVEIACKNRM